MTDSVHGQVLHQISHVAGLSNNDFFVYIALRTIGISLAKMETFLSIF